MELGKFSISLVVKNIERSLSFYKQLGFEVIDGGHNHEAFPDNGAMKWRVLSNESVKIGLFQGMFLSNLLAFSPNDVLAVQNNLKNAGISFLKEAVADSNDGHVSALLADPDGNQILLDQPSPN